MDHPQTKLTPIKVLFHSVNEGMHCDDGFGAAWVAQKYYSRIDALSMVEFIPVRYGEEPPYNKLQGANVLIIDFSYKKEMIYLIQAMAKSLVVLDHHKTAEKELQGIPSCIFDMNRSGAQITWDYFFPQETTPILIKIVQDNDLWRHQIPNCAQLVKWIRSFPQEFKSWDEINSQLTVNYDRCVGEAKGIDRYYQAQLQAQLGLATNIKAGLYRGVIVNAGKQYASDICEQLYKKYNLDFACSYFICPDGKAEVSIRSDGNVDVSDIAKRFGGGGHNAAAGWKTMTAQQISNYIAEGSF